ncbi:MAG: nuclear transport factor 2 family protein [Bacteroidota bacterium]
MMKHLVISLFIIAGFGPFAQAQNAQEEVEAAIYQLFDGMRAGDSSKVHAVFSDKVAFYTSTVREGKAMLFEGSLARFLKSVGSPHDKVFDERISQLQIHVDDNLATAWMNYSFYLGENFSHCGINTMTFHKEKEGWKMIFLADTRRKENCD